MKRNYNLSRIKLKYAYSYIEICKLFNIHIGTIHNWLKKGLQVIDEHRKPRLVLGGDLKKFLVKQKSKNKTKLLFGEFNCFKCRAARRSRNDQVQFKIDTATFSVSNHKAVIIGLCKVCGCKLHLFSSELKIVEMVKSGKMIIHQGERIKWYSSNPIKASFLGGRNES